uniref:Xylanolytic transcriptional activator regulatory domain-containing protein n=1 Tax=Mycena chlorophos TaxID=658473 RepID=A0ABQ0M1N3_MYCCL|nr:predicted protein [Mycena chlorophos]
MTTDENKPKKKRLVPGKRKDVCAECYRCKLRCNKQIPCESCVLRGCADLCPEGTLVSIGRGKRSVTADVPALTAFVSRMTDRIFELERAIEEHGASRHVLLSQRAQDRTQVANAIDAISDKLGALSMNADGNSVYFGVTGGPEALLSIEGSARYNSSSGWKSFSSPTQAVTLEHLRASLPLRARADMLCGFYFQHGAFAAIVMTQNEVVELFDLVYAYSHATTSKSVSSPAATNHHFACAFFLLTLGALVDFDQPPYPPEADFYFERGCDAMPTTSRADAGGGFLYSHPSVAFIQALALLATIHVQGGKQFSVETGWALICMADSAAKLLGLHRGSTYAKMEAKKAYHLKSLWWEVYGLEIILSLTLGRPPNTQSQDITVLPPEDSDEEGHPFRSTRFTVFHHGYFPGRWGFTTEVIAPTLEAFIMARTGKPNYAEILETARDPNVLQIFCDAPS